MSKSPNAPRSQRKALLWLVGIGASLILAGVILYTLMVNSMGAVPAGLDTASTRLTQGGAYRITYHSALDPIPINKIHNWTIHVESADGQPIENAQIEVDGGMPQHGHGLPTRPQVTQYLGNGDYTVEGMKFQMTGWWEVKFAVQAGGQRDEITFNLILK